MKRERMPLEEEEEEISAVTRVRERGQRTALLTEKESERERVNEVKPSVERKRSEFFGRSTRTIGLRRQVSSEERERGRERTHTCFQRGISVAEAEGEIPEDEEGM
jgi:hypothetical protein